MLCLVTAWYGQMLEPVDLKKVLGNLGVTFNLDQIKVLQGDLEYISAGYGLESCQSSTLCAACRCNNSTRPWTDARPGAYWRATLWSSKEEWLSQHEDVASIFELPGLWVKNIFFDIMHVKHLGLDSFLLGSVLKLLTFHKMAHSPQENLDWVWRQIESSYQDVGLTKCKHMQKCMSLLVGELWSCSTCIFVHCCLSLRPSFVKKRL